MWLHTSSVFASGGIPKLPVSTMPARSGSSRRRRTPGTLPPCCVFSHVGPYGPPSHRLAPSRCTWALEWERLRELAEGEGKTISRFIRDRVAERGESGHGGMGGGDAVALKAGEVREMHDAAVRAEELISHLVERPDDASPGLGEAIRLLFEARPDEMARTGRTGSMKALLTPIVDSERAVSIVRRALKRSAAHG